MVSVVHFGYFEVKIESTKTVSFIQSVKPDDILL